MSVSSIDAPFESPSLNYKKMMNSTSKSKALTNEDILIGRYLEKIQQPDEGNNNKSERRKLEIDSPYLQKLSHSNFLQTIVGQHQNRPGSSQAINNSHRLNSRNSNRPNSSAPDPEKFEPYNQEANSSPKSGGKNKINLKNKSDSLNFSFGKTRSSSFPMRRAESAQSLGRNNNKKKNMFRKMPQLLKAISFRNGSREISSYITARNLVEFLEIATRSLGFDRAARRIFLENGDEIKKESQLLKDTIVYVSCGEDFRDPFLRTKKEIDQRKSLQWRSEGVRFMSNEKNKHQKPQDESTCENNSPKNKRQNFTNKRFSQNSRCTKRLVAYENGNEFDPTLVFIEHISPNNKPTMSSDEASNLETKYLNEFLLECKNRMKIGGTVRCVYNWEGRQVHTLEDIPKLDKCLQSLVNDVEYTPVWVSKGEEFFARGALLFVQNLLKYTKLNRQNLLREQKKIKANLAKLEKERPNISAKLALTREEEYNENFADVEAKIEELDLSIIHLETIMSDLDSLNNKQKENGYASLFTHIKEIDTKQKIFGGLASKGLKLKIRINGTDQQFEMFFNPKDWSSLKNDKDAQKTQLKYLLDEITKNYQKNNSSFASMVKFTRMFTDKGEEIKEITKLLNGSLEFVCVSQGENWKEHKEITLALSVNLNMLFAMKTGQYESTKFTSEPEPEPEPEQPEVIEKPKYDPLAPAESINSENDDDAEFDVEIINYFKQKPTVATSQMASKSFAKPISTIYNSDLNFKTYIKPIKLTPKDYQGKPRKTLVPENINPNDDKPQLWEVLGEKDTMNKLSEYSVVGTSSDLIKDDVVEIEVSKAKRVLIQSKKEDDLFLYPQLFMNEKLKRGDTNEKNVKDSIFLHDFQDWKFNEAGYIYNSFFPKICLTLNTSVQIKLELYLKKSLTNNSQHAVDSHIIVKKGYAIVLGTRQLNDENNYRDKDQQWGFNKYGNIYSKALSDPKMVFTSTDLLLTELNNLSKSENSGVLERYELLMNDGSGFNELNSKEIGIFVLESFQRNETPSKSFLSLEVCQRWAIKQENSKSIGEWRHSKLSTTLWHKMALTWPVDENESLIDKFKWPISGCLIPGAPMLKDVDKPIEGASLRFRVLKNGSIDHNEDLAAVYVCKLDPKNLMKEFLHCSKISYRQFEFNMFLDSCTQALNFSTAARRIFDQQGIEYFELTNLKPDQVLYVSVGEAWQNPKQVKEELDKKSIMAGLSDDLQKIAYFNKLKQSEGCHFVVETFNMSIQEGVRLVLGKRCFSDSQIERINKGVSIQHVIAQDENENQEREEKIKTAHERSHEHTDAKAAKKFYWPWEVKIINKSLEGIFERPRNEIEQNSDNEEEQLEREFDIDQRDSLNLTRRSYDQEFGDRFKPKSKKSLKNLQFSSQKFAYNKSTGFIWAIDFPNLVFTVGDVEASVCEVFLAKKNEDNINQRWIYNEENGCIFSKARSNLCLTVKLPSLESSNFNINEPQEDQINDNETSILNQSAITIQTFVNFENGNSHQKWYIDESLGFIYAFATSQQKNTEITAINKAGICSYYVTFDMEISQPGYMCELILDTIEPSPVGGEKKLVQKIKKVLICTSCAKIIRGKFKTTRLSKGQNFACFIGKSKEKSLKQYDGFKYLHNKIDLSSNESLNSFSNWHKKYLALREETNAKLILNELSTGKSISMIKLYAYKNGNGRTKEGEMLMGTSIQGLLNQATDRLQLSSAARRFYTEDGTQILDAQDLIGWAIEFYKKELKKAESKVETKAEKITTKVTKQETPETNQETAKKTEIETKKVEFTVEKPNDEHSTNLNLNFEQNVEKSTPLQKPFNCPTRTELKRIFESRSFDNRKVLRWPIEVWVSCGEQFIAPKLVTKNENQKLLHREQIEKAEHELKIQSHTLRQMTGRRLKELNKGTYKSVKNPETPVVREGHWSEITFEEQVKQNEVNQLKNYVHDIKNPSSSRKNEKSARSSARSGANSSLYGAFNVTKRVRVYLNGEPPEKAQLCWASNLDELNEAAKIKLNLNKPIKIFFTQDGQIISKFEDLERDQMVCVSTGRDFITPQMRNKEIEIKANWSRVRKEEGANATKVKVNSKRNPIVDVDPFGPPILNTYSEQKLVTLALPASNSDEPVRSKTKLAEVRNKISSTPSDFIVSKDTEFGEKEADIEDEFENYNILDILD